MDWALYGEGGIGAGGWFGEHAKQLGTGRILRPGLAPQNATLQHVGQRVPLDAGTNLALVRVTSPILADIEPSALSDLIFKLFDDNKSSEGLFLDLPKEDVAHLTNSLARKTMSRVENYVIRSTPGPRVELNFLLRKKGEAS